MSTAKKRALLISAQVAAAITLYFIFNSILNAFVAEELHLGVALAALLAILGAIFGFVSRAAVGRGSGSPARISNLGSTHTTIPSAFSMVFMFASMGAVIGLMVGAPQLIQHIGETLAGFISTG